MVANGAASTAGIPEPPRLPNETTRAYARFVEFCRLGPTRSYVEMSRRFGKCPSAYEKMAVRRHWQRRVQDYDCVVQRAETERLAEARHVDDELRRAWERERRSLTCEMARACARVIQQLLGDPHVKFTEEYTVDGVTRLSPAHTSQLLHIAVLMREFNRLAQSASHDSIAELDLKLGQMDKGASRDAVQRIAGTFAVGDQMWGSEVPPEMPNRASAERNAAPAQLDPVAQVPEAKSTLPDPDLSDIVNLYRDAVAA
jgi:hypothetical protein